MSDVGEVEAFESLVPPPRSTVVDVAALRGRIEAAYGLSAYGGLSPRASAALQLLAARLAGGEDTLTPVDVADALGVVDELYRADRAWLARLETWVRAIDGGAEE